MATSFFSHLQNLWPFSIFKPDDLRISAQLVRRLSIPEDTKHFVFAIRDADSHAVVYILAAQNLSKQSALDAVYLIREVKPKAVVAQIAPSALHDIQAEEKCLKDGKANSVPTSPFGVLKRCFRDKMNKEQYEKLAGCQVLQEIFGIGFYGHYLAAKGAAEEIESHFFLLESPYENASSATPHDDAKIGKGSPGLHLQASYFPGKATSDIYANFRRFYLTDTLQLQMAKSLTPSLNSLVSKTSLSDTVSEPNPDECKLIGNYQAPPFGQTVYSLLVDLYDIFVDLPSMGKALVSAQKMLACISEGEPVSIEILSDVHMFRIAIEGLRVALNSVAQCPIDKMDNNSSMKVDFSKLPSEEKCHVLFAQALRTQAEKFGSVVAIVDAGCLAGIRRHWNTTVPLEVADLAAHCFTHYDSGDDLDDTDEETLMESMDKKGLLTDKPMVAVGAGATAILGASSLSKAVHASTFLKLATYKVPIALQCVLAQFQRTTVIGLSKILAQSKLLSPGIASAGAKTSSLKFAAAEKIRAVVHTAIASAERTSLLAMRTAFYEIMQRKHTQPVRFTPWVAFSCSMAACAGLVVHGDGIECAAESMPAVTMIASLGRGLQSLHHTSQEVSHTNGTRIKEALHSLMYNIRKMNVQ